MDASAYLRSRGWRGDGHGLGKTQSGIRKPLLISKKNDVLGVGLDRNQAVSDQWWLRAFDESLTNLGSGKGSLLGQVRKYGVSRGGYLGTFVEGQSLEGSIGSTPLDSGTGTPLQTDKSDTKMSISENTGIKRKRDDDGLQAENGANQEAERQMVKRLKTKSSDGSLQLADTVLKETKHIVQNALQLGYIPLGPSMKPKSQVKWAEQPNFAQYAEDANIKALYEQAAESLAGYNEMGAKKQKIAREKAKRDLRRAVKQYLSGSQAKSAPTDADGVRMVEEPAAVREKNERRALRKAEKQKLKGMSKKELRQLKEAKKVAKREMKKQKRTQLANGGRTTIDPPIPAGILLASSNTADPFADGQSEIKLATKNVPDLGSVPRNTSKGDKKMRKQAARAARAADVAPTAAVASSAPAVSAPTSSTPSHDSGNSSEIPPKKLAKYQERAAKKGISVEAYLAKKKAKRD